LDASPPNQCYEPCRLRAAAGLGSRSRAAGPERTGLCVKNRDHDFVIVTL